MARYLSEPEAWVRIAELVIDRPPEVLGLATAAGYLHRDLEEITHETYAAINRRRQSAWHPGAYLSADEGAWDEQAMLALLLALEAEEDARSARASRASSESERGGRK
jgi:hypothetical protein